MSQNKSIIVKLSGRFGNQLFQYATGYALAKINGFNLAVDISEYQIHQKMNDYTIGKLIPDIIVAKSSDVKKAIGFRFPFSPKQKIYWKTLSKVEHILLLKKLFFAKSYIREPHFQYWSELKKINKSCLIYGVWQSELYFKEYRKDLLNIFELKKLSCIYSNDFYKRIQNDANSVAVHIRRGDYLNPQTQSFHGVCDLEYYQKSMKIVSEQAQNPSFYIFTDDPEWATAQFKDLANVELIVPPNECDDVDSFWLMRTCRHQIIANSSFSWWAAWLNQNSQKIVIAPKKWFQNSDIITTDIYPKEWILV